MTEDLGSFENRYRSPKYVELWMADKGLETRRIQWRKRLVASLPFDSSDSLRILDMGAGTGGLSLEILESFPNASVTSQDFSQVMLSHAREQLAGFEGRVTFVQSDLRTTGWTRNIEGTFDAIVASFVTHTVASSVKAIYAELFGLVKPGGCFLSCEGFSSPGPSLEKLYNKLRLQDYREQVKVIDIFDAAGMKKPDISLLSEEFLQDVKDLKRKNLALELLKKLLNDEIKARLTYNIVEGKKLLEMLEESIKKYQNNLLTTAEIIDELVDIARQIRTVDGLPDKLKLSKDEFAFYTALEVNDSAVKVLGDETLKTIAREIADKVKKNATIDWTMKESARAKLMVIVKRTLNKYGYPPDKQQKA